MNRDIFWVDTHAHLADEKFDEDRALVLARAKEAGVRLLVEIGDGPFEWDKARVLAAQNPGFLWWAAGFHPYYADQVNEETLARLRSFAEDPSFVAVGEIGLDYAKSTLAPATQKDAFLKLLNLADDLEKPVIIHCRDAYADLIGILTGWHRSKPRNPAVSPGVIHCFSGTAADAAPLLEMGFYFGVDGPLTYPSAKGLREALRGLPLSRLVLETDSPYLPPQTHRGQRNEPAHIPALGRALAALFGVAEMDLFRILFENSHFLYRRTP